MKVLPDCGASGAHPVYSDGPSSGLEDVRLPFCSLAAASVEQLWLCDRLLDEPDRGVVEVPHLSRALRLCDRLLDETDRGGVDVSGPGRLRLPVCLMTSALPTWEALCPAHSRAFRTSRLIRVLSGAANFFFSQNQKKSRQKTGAKAA